MSTVRAEPVTTGSPPRRVMAGFWVAAAVAVLGVMAAVGWATVSAISAVGSTEELARGEVPGTVVAQVTEPRTLVVYYEGDPVPELGQLALRVTGPSGRFVTVGAYPLALKYDSPVSPGTVGTAVATFDATRAGTYRVETAFVPLGEARLAVGDDVGRGFLQTLVGPATLVVLSLLLASGIAVLTAVRVNRRYRRG